MYINQCIDMHEHDHDHDHNHDELAMHVQVHM